MIALLSGRLEASKRIRRNNALYIMEKFNPISLGDVNPRGISDTFAPSWDAGGNPKQ
jgi:hypothetical protein